MNEILRSIGLNFSFHIKNAKASSFVVVSVTFKFQYHALK